MEHNNKEWEIISLRDRVDMSDKAAAWFHEKWNVPETVYLESIQESQKNPSKVPQWYLVIDKDKIIGGFGLIENDFHKRKDLTPNVCAVFVEKEYRNCGVAKSMLDFSCKEAQALGYSNVYLITDHEQFYEKCGWHYLCMVEEDSGQLVRMYEISTKSPSK